MNGTPFTKPLPIITPDTAPFWEGCRQGRLMLQRCEACTTWRYPPSPVCPRCASTDFRWTPTQKKGRIHSFVIYHRAFHPAYTTEIPYAVALVELEEKVRLPLQVVYSPLHELCVDLEGKIQFPPGGDTVPIPVFVPFSQTKEDRP